MKFKKYQLRFLAWLFAALLPREGDDREGKDGEPGEVTDYYRLLGVARNADADGIRRAYRKRSLQLHPDKIMQRGSAGGRSEEDLRRDFQRLKEAYDALRDPDKREVYDALGPVGIKFLTNPQGALDPNSVLENLAASDHWDRTKLFAVVVLLVLILFAQPILICAKVEQDLDPAQTGSLVDTSWYAILLPTWFIQTALLVVLVGARAYLPGLRLVLAVWAELFLCARWDGSWAVPYRSVLAPVYLLGIVRALDALRRRRDALSDLDRMVTLDEVENEIIPSVGFKEGGGGPSDEESGFGTDPGGAAGGATADLAAAHADRRRYGDLTNEERDRINEAHIVVHAPPGAAEALGEAIPDPTARREALIALSPEGRAATEEARRALGTVGVLLLVYMPTLILLVVKADRNVAYGWWHVSIPLWLRIGWVMTASFFRCCTAGVEGAEREEEAMAAAAAMVDGEGRDGDAEGGAGGAGDGVEPLAPPPSRPVPSRPALLRPAASPPPAGKMTDESITGAADELVIEEEVRAMKVAELKSELKARGIPTAGYVERSDLVAAVARARASSPGLTPPTSPDSPANADEDPYLDEETFRAWASAQVEDETSPSEAGAKAFGKCCEQVLLSIMLALFVGKLASEDGSDADGYSSFWVIFPFLLFGGVLLLCCGCSIYCAEGAQNLEENVRTSVGGMTAKRGGDVEEGAVPEAGAEAVAALAPVTPTDAAAVHRPFDARVEAADLVHSETDLSMPPPPPPGPSPSAKRRSSQDREEVQSEASDDLD